MKDLSRADIGRLVQGETTKLVWATALLFLTAGSLWTHFALGHSFLHPSIFLSWVLIHSCSFLSLKFKNLGRILVLSSVFCMQLYFYTTLRRLELPYIPMAPLFFMLSTLAMTAYFVGSRNLFAGVWVGNWLGALLWMPKGSGGTSLMNEALFFAWGINALFFAGFFLTTYFSLKSIQLKMDLTGGRNDYDEQRLHAAQLQSLGELSAGIAHEINNPLAAINGYSHQIRGEILENKVPSVPLLQAANDRIKFNVDRIIEITKAMRSFSRRGGEELNTPVVIQELIHDSYVLVRNSFKTKKIEFRIENPDPEIAALGNFVQLSQLLVNLLSNAKDACENSQVKVVTVGCTATLTQVSLWVEDTGSGIPEDIAKNIFKPFFTTKGIHKGTGLGLYIAQIVAQRHQAQLHFETIQDASHKALGTRFIVNLKRATPASKASSFAA